MYRCYLEANGRGGKKKWLRRDFIKIFNPSTSGHRDRKKNAQIDAHRMKIRFTCTYSGYRNARENTHEKSSRVERIKFLLHVYPLGSITGVHIRALASVRANISLLFERSIFNELYGHSTSERQEGRNNCNCSESNRNTEKTQLPIVYPLLGKERADCKIGKRDNEHERAAYVKRVCGS